MLRVARHRIQAHQVARGQLEILQRNHMRAVRRLRPLLRKQRNRLLRAAVHRVAQAQFLQPEIVVAFHAHRHFLNRTRLRIPPWLRYFHHGGLVLARFNEKVFAQPHVLALLHAGHVVHAVFVNRHARGEAGPAAIEGNLAVVAQHQQPLRQGLIGLDLHLRLGSFHRPQVAARILRQVRQPGPLGVVINHPHLLDARQIHHPQREVLGLNRARLHEILHRLRQTAEQELVAVALGLRRHVHLLPFRRPAILREEPRLPRIESRQSRRHQHVGPPTHGLVSRLHHHVVKRLRPYFGSARPQQRRAVAEKARTRQNQP